MWPFTSSPYDGLLKTIDQVATPLVNSSRSSKDAKEVREYDYIIVGGGTAGCVLARRLSESPDISVLVLESGGVSAPWTSNVPLLFMRELHDDSILSYAHKWSGIWKEGSAYDRMVDHSKLADPFTYPPSSAASITKTSRTSRHVAMLAGNTLGGSTKINQQLYTHPFAGELNSWADSCKDPSWSYDNTLELMKRSENVVRASTAEKEYRGQYGPWLIQKYDKIYFNSCKRVLKACEAIRIPFIAESNRPDGPAIKLTETERTMIGNGKRFTTFEAFLPLEILKERKSRLTVCTGVVVSSIDVRGDNGDLTSKGVFLEPASGKKAKAEKYYIAAKREVILCSGAIISPQLLLLSGIGPKKHLEEMGIPVIKHLPGVGAHFQDHPGAAVIYSVPAEDSIFSLRTQFLTLIKEALKYFLFGTGLFIFPIPQLLLLVRSALLHDAKDGSIKVQANVDPSQLDARIPENIPDIELQGIAMQTAHFILPTRKSRGSYTLFCLSMQPHSLGSVTLSSRNPHERPKCTLGLFSHPNDFEIMRKAVKLALKIGRTMKEQGYDIEPLWVPRSTSDEDLDEFILFEPRCNFHLSSSCRMAPEFSPGVSALNEDDVNEAGVGKTPGVVDSQLRVYGIKGLRVADASIFPTVPACHLQAPVVLVAEKCAEIIKATWL